MPLRFGRQFPAYPRLTLPFERPAVNSLLRANDHISCNTLSSCLLPGFLSLVGYLFFRFFSRLPSPSIPYGQCMRSLPSYSGGQPDTAERLLQFSAIECPVPSDGSCPELSPSLCQLPSNELPPFAPRQGFWLLTVPTNQAVGHPGFLLQTVTSFLRPGLHHYYGFICHLAPPRKTLSSLLNPPFPLTARNDTRLPQLPRTPCQLPHPQSLHESDQVSGFALFGTLTHS